MARNSSNHLLRDSWTETLNVRFSQEATVTRMGLTNGKGKKDVMGPQIYTRQHYSYTLEAQAHEAGGWPQTFSILMAGTGLSLRNLVLWWDSPRLSAGTSAGRRSATVALCNSSIKPQGKLCVQPLARASTVSSQAVAHLLRTSSSQSWPFPRLRQASHTHSSPRGHH